MSPLDDALRFGGLALSHAAWIASDLEEGQLICPIAMIEREDVREVIPFEAETQQEAVEQGLQKIREFTDVDRWTFIREGLMTRQESVPKVDVLRISSWSLGLDEPLTVVQRFSPNWPGPFGLIGSPIVAIHGIVCEEPTQSRLRALVEGGARSHPQGEMWMKWRGRSDT